MQNRDEKILDCALDSIIQRVVDIKNSLQQLLIKIESQGEQSDWPQYLDSFSVISAQIFSMVKLLKNDRANILRNYVTLPTRLNAEPDDTLLRITEQRVPSFSHDFVPDLLRTKPDPEVEAKLRALENKIAPITNEVAIKHIGGHNKVVKNILELVSTTRDDWETDSASRAGQPQTCSLNETQILVAALGIGKGIKNVPRAQPPGPSPTLQSQQQSKMKIMSGVTKAPSSIKTNIKSAAQMHPYGR